MEKMDKGYKPPPEKSRRPNKPTPAPPKKNEALVFYRQPYETTKRIVDYFKAMNPKLQFPRLEYEFDIYSIILDEKNVK